MKGFNIYINCILDVLLEDGRIYKSRVQEINSGEIAIDIPTENGEYVLLENGQELSSILYNEKCGMAYKLKFKTIGRKVENNVRLYRLSKPYDIEKFQRRNYVRVTMAKPIKYKKADSIRFYDGVVLDLSGGGMRIKVSEEVKLGDEVELLIDLEGKFAKIKGKIKRVDMDERNNPYIVGFEFTEISEAVRDRVIQIVFSAMRKQIEVL